MAQKVITIILGLIIVGGLAWFINKNYLQPPMGQIASKPQRVEGSFQAPRETSRLIYATYGPSREIWEGEEGFAKKIYTDADEREKILKISNLAPQSREVLVITSSDPRASSGQLIVINLDSLKKEVLQEKFPSLGEMAVSEDGRKIAITQFSNTEENYGFSFYFEERDGQARKQIATSLTEIKGLSWQPGSAKIAFVVTSGQMSELKSADLSSAETTGIKSLEATIIDWVTWEDSENLILASHRLNEEKSGEISRLNLQTKNLEKISSVEGGLANYVFENSQKFIGYLVAQYQGKTDDKTAGQIYILKNSQKIPLPKGSQVLGWLP